jgi:hypothetical protein
VVNSIAQMPFLCRDDLWALGYGGESIRGPQTDRGAVAKVIPTAQASYSFWGTLGIHLSV